MRCDMCNGDGLKIYGDGINILRGYCGQCFLALMGRPPISSGAPLLYDPVSAVTSQQSQIPHPVKYAPFEHLVKSNPTSAHEIGHQYLDKLMDRAKGKNLRVKLLCFFDTHEFGLEIFGGITNVSFQGVSMVVCLQNALDAIDRTW